MQHTDLQLLRSGAMSHIDLGWKYDSITPVTHSADQIITPPSLLAFLVKSTLKHGALCRNQARVAVHHHHLFRPGPMSHIDMGWKYDSITPVTHCADQTIIPPSLHAFLYEINHQTWCFMSKSSKRCSAPPSPLQTRTNESY